MRSASHREALRERFAIGVLGDSTHIGIGEGHQMLAWLKRVLPEPPASEFHWFGVAAGGYNAVDFYLLANSMAAEPPDLLVVPVNLRSFGPAWLHDPGYRVPELDRHLLPSELWFTRSLNVGGRTLPMGAWLLRRLDARWFGGEIERRLRGVEIIAERESERIAERIEGPLAPLTGRPDGSGQLADLAVWEPRISADHELFRAFHLLNGLAARRGFEILYYTVIPNTRALVEQDIEIHMWRNFDLIEQQIGRARGVHFLGIREPVPEWMYRDEIDHLKPAGIEWMAEHIAQRVDAIRRLYADAR